MKLILILASMMFFPVYSENNLLNDNLCIDSEKFFLFLKNSERDNLEKIKISIQNHNQGQYLFHCGRKSFIEDIFYEFRND